MALVPKPVASQQATTYRVDGYHSAVIGPGAQLHAAILLIKGKVGDNDLTVAFKDGWRCPGDVASVVQEHLGEFDNGKVAVCTVVGIREENGSDSNGDQKPHIPKHEPSVVVCSLEAEAGGLRLSKPGLHSKAQAINESMRAKYRFLNANQGPSQSLSEDECGNLQASQCNT